MFPQGLRKVEDGARRKFTLNCVGRCTHFSR
jgi:hypothetical protein